MESLQMEETEIKMRPFSIVLQTGFKVEPTIVKETMNVCKMRPFVILLPKCNLDKYVVEKSVKNEEHYKLLDKYKMKPFFITLPKFYMDKYNYFGGRSKSKSMKRKCDRCEESFGGKNKLLQHRREVHYKKMVLPDGRAKCDRCNTIYESWRKLCRHSAKMCEYRRTHSDLTCPICSMKLKEVNYLKRHVREIHMKLKPYQCDRCDKTFSRKPTLEDHINVVHDKIKNYKCDECDVLSATRHVLKRHILEVHNHKRPHKCPACHKSFFRKFSLDRHFDSVHSNLRIHPCLICSKVFKDKYYATHHMRKFHSYVREIRGIGMWLEDQLKESEE